MRKFPAFTIMTAIGLSTTTSQAAPMAMCDGRPPIEREQIELMFDNMRAGTS